MTVQAQTIRALNQLNQQFYQQVATDFSHSRQQAWTGWEKILPILQKNKFFKKKIKVLDIACGNGRFAWFLQDRGLDFSYSGLDNNRQLLKLAKKSLMAKKIEHKLEHFDLIDNYLKQQEINWPVTKTFNLIVVFGLSHHLPGQKLRKTFLASLENLLNQDGLLVISNWQFAKNKQRFEKHYLNQNRLKKLNLEQQSKLARLIEELENNDYLLDWRSRKATENQQQAWRYCHLIDEQEMQLLLKDSQWQLESSFLADGKSQKLNQYFVLKKTG